MQDERFVWFLAIKRWRDAYYETLRLLAAFGGLPSGSPLYVAAHWIFDGSADAAEAAEAASRETRFRARVSPSPDRQ